MQWVRYCCIKCAFLCLRAYLGEERTDRRKTETGTVHIVESNVLKAALAVRALGVQSTKDYLRSGVSSKVFTEKILYLKEWWSRDKYQLVGKEYEAEGAKSMRKATMRE